VRRGVRWRVAVEGCGGGLRWRVAVEGCGGGLRWRVAVEGCGEGLRWRRASEEKDSMKEKDPVVRASVVARDHGGGGSGGGVRACTDLGNLGGELDAHRPAAHHDGVLCRLELLGGRSPGGLTSLQRGLLRARFDDLLAVDGRVEGAAPATSSAVGGARDGD
jgi:hypothetical protein